MDFDEVYAYTRSLSLLYVEDESGLRESTRSLLENYFAKVDVARNGRQGLDEYKDALEERPYDIVLTDINMPVRNGIDLAKDIRQLKKEQIIVFLSAHHESECISQTAEFGSNNYLFKPIKLDELNAMLYFWTKEPMV